MINLINTSKDVILGNVTIGIRKAITLDKYRILSYLFYTVYHKSSVSKTAKNYISRDDFISKNGMDFNKVTILNKGPHAFTTSLETKYIPIIKN